MPILTRLYVWSVIFEPLFLFVLFEEATSGVTGSLARILQVATGVGLAGRLLIYLACRGKPWPVPNLTRPLYRNFAAMFVLAVVAGVIGYATGAYDLPSAYRAFTPRSSFSRILNSANVRPLFEYVTALYYFGYFVVLAQYLLTTKAHIDYALSRFKLMFVLSLVIGVIDLALTTRGIYWLPRHLSDWSRVGPQFHGFAGEPRQAFVYLFLGLAILHLAAFRNGQRLARLWLPAIVIAAVLTQSMTGFVAIAMFLGLYAIAAASDLGMYRFLRIAVGFTVVASLAFGVAVNTKRLVDYFKSASDLWTVLETGQELPFLMSKSNSDIYPMYDLTVKARAGQLLPVVIGSGFGSASAVSNRYYHEAAEMNNPHSQLARSLYETGLLGTLLYVLSFVAPVRAMTRPLKKKQQRQFLLLTLLVLACGLADRSSAPFIYLGWLAAAFRVDGASSNESASKVPVMIPTVA